MKNEKLYKEFYCNASNHISAMKSVYDVVVRMSKIAWQMSDMNAYRMDDMKRPRRFDISSKHKDVETRTSP